MWQRITVDSHAVMSEWASYSNAAGVWSGRILHTYVGDGLDGLDGARIAIEPNDGIWQMWNRLRFAVCRPSGHMHCIPIGLQ